MKLCIIKQHCPFSTIFNFVLKNIDQYVKNRTHQQNTCYLISDKHILKSHLFLENFT